MVKNLPANSDNLRQKPWNTLNILAPLPSPSLLQCCCSQWNTEMSSQLCTGERGVSRIFGEDCSSWSIIIHSSSSAIEHFIVDEDFFPLFWLYIYILYMFHFFIFEKRATFTMIITLRFHEQFLSKTKKIHCVQQFHNPILSVTLGNSIWRFKWWKFLADFCFCLRPRIYFRILLTLFSVHSLEKNYLFSLFFPGRKRFTVPRDDDTSVPPTPVRIFLARYEVASPADVQQPVVSDDVVEGDENIPVSTCDFA